MAAPKSTKGKVYKYKIYVRKWAGTPKGKLYERYFKNEKAMNKAIEVYEKKHATASASMAKAERSKIEKRISERAAAHKKEITRRQKLETAAKKKKQEQKAARAKRLAPTPAKNPLRIRKPKRRA